MIRRNLLTLSWAEIRALGFVGTNVTFPYKQIAIDSADEVNDAVKKVGASNTLLLKDGKVCAFQYGLHRFYSRL